MRAIFSRSTEYLQTHMINITFNNEKKEYDTFLSMK